MKLSSLNDVLFHELQDLHSVEKQLSAALAKLSQKAHHPELKETLNSHLEETQNHQARLKNIERLIGESLDGEECKGMKGIIEEGEKVIDASGNAAAIDAAIISAAQKAEHYEIATYGTAVSIADALELDEIEDLLQENLDEEGDANKKLTRLAEGNIFVEGINEKSA
jgi:ferritin-like metal-binding protein YciE